MLVLALSPGSQLEAGWEKSLKKPDCRCASVHNGFYEVEGQSSYGQNVD